MKIKKLLSRLLVLAMVFSLTACGGKENKKDEGILTPTESTKPTEGPTPGELAEGTFPTIDSLVLGEDYTELKADLKFLTHRADIVDTKLAAYVMEFQKLYPNIKITYEVGTDFREDVIIKLTTSDWGDICMIPATILKTEVPDLFVSYGDHDTIAQTYDFVENYTYENKVYGIASTVNVQGVLYNKRVFEEAGVTAILKTPKEFLTALQTIKDKTEAIPLYTNFSEGWTMGAWDAYIGVSATADPDFMNNVITHQKDPFADRGDSTGPYAVYNLLYEAVARGLIEDDPIATDWEASKGMLNRGEIATMVLGSWAVTQIQAADVNPEDIGYMPFPITVDGKQAAAVDPDYMYGININSSKENKIASMLYIKWLTEVSNFAYSEGSIPIVKGTEYPPVLDLFAGVELFADNPAVAGEETLFHDLNTKSEIGINLENTHVQRVLEEAFDKNETMDEIAADWNAKWNSAQTELGVAVK